MLEAQKQSLELTCRDLDVRMGEKRDNIGDAWSNDSDEVLEENLREFDEKYQKLVSRVERQAGRGARAPGGRVVIHGFRWIFWRVYVVQVVVYEEERHIFSYIRLEVLSPDWLLNCFCS